LIDRLIEVGRRCGMEMNVENPKIMRISRQPSPVQFMIDLKQRENVEYFKYVCSLITNDVKCLREIKSRIDMAKAAVNKKKNFHQQIRLKFKEEISEIWTLRKID